jgi:hypothetical protein
MSTTKEIITKLEDGVTSTVTKWDEEAETLWQKFHHQLSAWLNHAETAARASGWASIAYAAWTFAKHLVP